MVLCGGQRTVDLRVAWNNDPRCPYPGWGANRYRLTVRILKGNSVLSTRVYRSSSCWVNDFYRDFVVTPGQYRAQATLEVRGAFWSWRTQWTDTRAIIVTQDPSVPGLEINGQVPDPSVPIEVCPAEIIIDPSSTSCEDRYWIGIWEYDFVNQARPQEYEWGKWFDGQAPASLNLQQLSAQYSFGNDFLGNDPNREGEILYGGNLSNNTPRHYRVEVCTGQPAWTCTSAIIKVKCSCP